MIRRAVPNDLSFGQLFLLQEIAEREASSPRQRKPLLRHPEFPAAAVLGLLLGFAGAVYFLSFQSNGLAEAGQAAVIVSQSATAGVLNPP